MKFTKTLIRKNISPNDDLLTLDSWTLQLRAVHKNALYNENMSVFGKYFGESAFKILKNIFELFRKLVRNGFF